MEKILIKVALVLFFTNICNAQCGKNNCINLTGIWQLDYYPDSMLIKRDISNYSKWSSSYAYNIQFIEDSCQFIGWNESLWLGLLKKEDNEYKTDSENQFWEIKLLSNQKLILREIHKRKNRTDTGNFLPYHKIDYPLTQKQLKSRVAKEFFCGDYIVLFNSALRCDSVICLDDKYSVTGVKGFDRYCFKTAINIDFPIPNYFAFETEDGKNKIESSFSFSGDTLFLKDFGVLQENKGDFSGFNITKTKLILLKAANPTVQRSE